MSKIDEFLRLLLEAKEEENNNQDETNTNSNDTDTTGENPAADTPDNAPAETSPETDNPDDTGANDTTTVEPDVTADPTAGDLNASGSVETENKDKIKMVIYLKTINKLRDYIEKLKEQGITIHNNEAEIINKYQKLKTIIDLFIENIKDAKEEDFEKIVEYLKKEILTMIDMIKKSSNSKNKNS
jgi:hypothetical protein